MSDYVVAGGDFENASLINGGDFENASLINGGDFENASLINGGGLPTLLLPGKVVPKPWMSSADKAMIDSQPGVKFIMNWLSQFIPERRGVPLKKPAKKPGERYLALKSGTGSGKSTTLPVEIFRTFFENIHKNIGMTEPRVFNCIDIVDSILKLKVNSDFKEGENIGYQTGNFKKKPNKGIVVETIGVLLQQLKTLSDEDFMKKYFIIIIDEVHARGGENDPTMSLLKKLIERNYENPDCPFVILTSGTFDEKLFMEYFDMPESHYIEVIGSTFPIEFRWQAKPVVNLVETIVKTVKDIHISSEGIHDLDKVGDSITHMDKIIPIKEIGLEPGDNNPYRDILIIVDSTALMDRLTYEIHKLNLEPEIKSVGYIIPIPINSARFASGGKQYQQLMSSVDSIRGQIMKKESANIKLGGYGVSCSHISAQQHIPDEINGGVLIKDLEVGFDGFTEGGMSPTELLEQIKWEPTYVNFVRRVIIATNLIETGITIDSLKYCIDTGLMFSTDFNPIYNAGTLVSGPITQGMAVQRRGRVGRKSPGVWYPMYTKELFDSLVKDQYPDIITKEFTSALLSIIVQDTESSLDRYSRDLVIGNKMGFSVSAIDIMGYPAVDSIEYSLEKLYYLGMITTTDHKIDCSKNTSVSLNSTIIPTKLGVLANKFRKVKLESVRMILSGYYHKANIMDLITIAIMIDSKWDDISLVRKHKYFPRNVLNVTNSESEMYSKLFWADEFIECLWIWYDFMEVLNSIDPKKSSKTKKLGVGYAKRWCEDNGFKYDGLLGIIQARDELIDSMINIGVNPYYNGLNLKRGTYNLKTIINKDLNIGMSEIAKIKSCIYDGYKLNTATYDKNKRAYVSDWRKCVINNVESKLVRPIQVPESERDVRQMQPTHIIFSGFLISANRNNRDMYILGAENMIGVLDGFVDIDDGIIYQW